MCQEKWVIQWRDPETKKKQKVTLYDENEALGFLIEKMQQGIDTKHRFYDCGPKK